MLLEVLCNPKIPAEIWKSLLKSLNLRCTRRILLIRTNYKLRICYDNVISTAYTFVRVLSLLMSSDNTTCTVFTLGSVRSTVRHGTLLPGLAPRSHLLVSRSQTVTLAVTVWTTAVKRFVLSSPGSRVGDKWLLSASGTAGA